MDVFPNWFQKTSLHNRFPPIVRMAHWITRMEITHGFYPRIPSMDSIDAVSMEYRYSINTASAPCRISCSNIHSISILYRYSIDTISIQYRYSIDTGSMQYRYCIHTVSILYRSRMDTVSILYRYSIDTVSI